MIKSEEKEGQDTSVKTNRSENTPVANGVKKKDSNSVPLNISKEESKDKKDNDSGERKKEELGIIPEEMSEHSTIVPQIGKGHRGLTQKLSAKGTIGENVDMKDLFHSLNKLSISENDIKEVSQEFSKASDSREFYPQNVSNSSLSKYNKHLNQKNKDSKQVYPDIGHRWEIEDSGIQSISNITNYINPEENQANEGMIQSALVNNSNNPSSPKNSRLEVDMMKSTNKQQSRIINISEYYSDTSKAELECKCLQTFLKSFGVLVI